MTPEEALRALAEYDGLVRFSREPGQQREVRVAVRLPWDHEQRVVAVNPVGMDDPVQVMAATLDEALAEVGAAQSRLGLRLVR